MPLVEACWFNPRLLVDKWKCLQNVRIIVLKLYPINLWIKCSYCIVESCHGFENNCSLRFFVDASYFISN